MKETMVSSLTMVLALTVPATFGLIILAEPIIRLIFEHGAFTEADTVATARTLAFYAVGLFAYSANKVLVPAFYALDKTKYPVVASFLAIGTNIVFITLTIDTYQHLAIAMSTSCTMILNFLFLFTTLHIKMQGFRLKYLARALLKILCAAAGLLAVLVAGQSVLETVLHGNRIVQFLAVMVLIGVSATVYGVILYLFKLEEMTVFIQQIKEKVLPAK